MADFVLKSITEKGIEGALAKASHYRELNEPRAAESICLDILEVDKSNQEAIILLILSLTDQLADGVPRVRQRGQKLLNDLSSEYDSVYYGGIICERQGKAILKKGYPGSGFDTYEWLHDAMELYERAESLSDEGNDDAILRWNNCARIIMNRRLEPRPEDKSIAMLE